jgi:hypothetical protein
MKIIIRLTGLIDSEKLPVILTKELPPQSNPSGLQILATLSQGDKVGLEGDRPGEIFGSFTNITGEISEIKKLVVLYIPTVTIRSLTIRVEILQVRGHAPSTILDSEHGLKKLLDDGWVLT